MRPGDLLHSAIALITERGIECGRCARWRAQMNRWGWWGCLDRLPIIMRHLRREAARWGLKRDPLYWWPWYLAKSAWRFVARRYHSR